MKTTIPGYKLVNNVLEVGLYNEIFEPISVFHIEIKKLAKDYVNYLNITENSFKAAIYLKEFFKQFDHCDYTIEDAIKYFNEDGVFCLYNDNSLHTEIQFKPKYTTSPEVQDNIKFIISSKTWYANYIDKNNNNEELIIGYYSEDGCSGEFSLKWKFIDNELKFQKNCIYSDGYNVFYNFLNYLQITNQDMEFSIENVIQILFLNGCNDVTEYEKKINLTVL